MTLGVVIGDDLVGRYVAERIRTVSPDSCVIGLDGARPWLDTMMQEVDYVSALEFRRLVSILKHHSVDQIVFAGGAARSIRAWKLDSTALHYIVSRAFPPTRWFPHAYLNGLRTYLIDNNINPISVVDVIPELGMPSSKIAARDRGYDAASDVAATIAKMRATRWRWVRQAHIVDRGRVCMSETDGTDKLLREFGASMYRRSAAYPVLCKLAIEPFENIVPATIGEDTVRIAIECGVRAIVVQARKTIVMQKEKFQESVDKNLISIFVA